MISIGTGPKRGEVLTMVDAMDALSDARTLTERASAVLNRCSQADPYEDHTGVEALLSQIARGVADEIADALEVIEASKGARTPTEGA